MGGLIDMERKGCELVIPDYDFDLSGTMVGWVDVPHSDGGDYRCRRAINIFDFYVYYHQRLYQSL